MNVLCLIVWAGFWTFVSIIGWWSWASWRSARIDGCSEGTTDVQV